MAAAKKASAKKLPHYDSLAGFLRAAGRGALPKGTKFQMTTIDLVNIFVGSDCVGQFDTDDLVRSFMARLGVRERK